LDGDEIFALIACGILGARFLLRWYGGILLVNQLACSYFQRLVLGLAPLGCLILLQFVLTRWSAHEVREGPEYDLLFILGGAAWLGFAVAMAMTLGISARDDAIESRNGAAVAAICGGMTGSMLCYAGANIGEGATIWMTFQPAVLATATWFALWFVLELAARVADAVAIDRDLASGLRLGGCLIATGLILGTAVAGDWHSWGETIHDFTHQAWPAALLTFFAAVLQFLWRPTPVMPSHPVFRRGLLPATIFVCLSILYVLWLGPFEHLAKGG
jgi:hypothetical protein